MGQWLRDLGHGAPGNDNPGGGAIPQPAAFIVADGVDALRPSDLFEDLSERAWLFAPPIPLAAAPALLRDDDSLRSDDSST